MLGDTNEEGKHPGMFSRFWTSVRQMNERGKVRGFLSQGRVADEWAAYPNLSHRSEQLSCTKYFHPSYGLFYINFQRSIQFMDLFIFQN